MMQPDSVMFSEEASQAVRMPLEDAGIPSDIPLDSSVLPVVAETPKPVIPGRKGVLDVGLNGKARPIDLDVEPACIYAGLKIIEEILAVAEEKNISDIQIQSDKHIRIDTTDGLEVFGTKRLNSQDVVGILLALVYNRRSDIALNGFLQDRERSDMAKVLAKKRVAHFSSQGGAAYVFSEEKRENCDYSMRSGNFRVCAFFTTTGLSLTCRIHKSEIVPIEDVGLPPDVVKKLQQFVQKSSGLGLITGKTGSGKTTTIAALINWVQLNTKMHIITMEDPVEFHFPDSVSTRGGGERPLDSLVSQQELGREIIDFESGGEDSLRKRPYVILVGEIRSSATMEACLRAADAGHFVLATLHTKSATDTLGRIIELYKKKPAAYTLNRVATYLHFILSQGLLPPYDSGARKRVLAVEFFQVGDTTAKAAVRVYHENQQTVRDLMNRGDNISWETNLKNLETTKKISKETYSRATLELVTKSEKA